MRKVRFDCPQDNCVHGDMRIREEDWRKMPVQLKRVYDGYRQVLGHNKKNGELQWFRVELV